MKMMKHILFTGLAIALLQFCGTSSNPQKEIFIYGSSQCSHCTDLTSALDSEGYLYTFNDVYMNDPLTIEMVDTVRGTGFQGQISFPVVFVDGELMIAPKHEVLFDLLKN